MSKFNTKQTYNKETFLEEIELLVPKEDFDKYFEKALVAVTKTSTAPGFRKGKVPKNVVLANRYNEIADRAVELVVNDAILNLGDLDPKPLEHFHVKSIDSAAEDANADLKITLTYLPLPKVELPDFSKIKVAKAESRKATKEEVDKELENIWFAYAGKMNPEVKKEDFAKDKITKEFLDESGMSKENPELTSLESLEKFIEEFINRTYEQSAMVETDEKIKEAIVEAAKFEKVDGIVEREVEKRVDNYLGKFREIGMDPAEYLEKNNIKIDDLRKDWQTQSAKDVKFELVLQEYGRIKEIKPTEEEVQAELSKLDPETKKSYNNDEDRLRSLINYYYINNKSYVDLFEQIRETNKQ